MVEWFYLSNLLLQYNKIFSDFGMTVSLFQSVLHSEFSQIAHISIIFCVLKISKFQQKVY